MKSSAKENLLAAAIMLFARDGYAETALSAIAARTGTSSAFVRCAFGGKKDLYKEALHRAVVNLLTEGGPQSLLQQSALLVTQALASRNREWRRAALNAFARTRYGAPVLQPITWLRVLEFNHSALGNKF